VVIGAVTLLVADKVVTWYCYINNKKNVLVNELFIIEYIIINIKKKKKKKKNLLEFYCNYWKEFGYLS